MQLTMLSLPSPEFVCEGHATHDDSEVCPVCDEYFPPIQSEHATDPVTSLYSPAVHWLHDPPSGPVYPLLQVQFAILTLPSPDDACCGHELHVDSDDSPVFIEYLPRVHCEHTADPLTSL